ncbi:uncharacterized protein LOC121800275 isoform X3 [Salvia splendens]|uniref:uncharacterized protein LOC121800275 isoform X3 n=1 Tax=Salvia splendens TaxID=180675 RepID=UPI001C255473|nr:uncharacterized protein LOC121800275 isoform X3 [Salvia splendens]
MQFSIYNYTFPPLLKYSISYLSVDSCYFPFSSARAVKPLLLLGTQPSSISTMQQAGSSASETEVTWEDQQNINKFGRLNNRLHEVEDEIKIAKLMGRKQTKASRMQAMS